MDDNLSKALIMAGGLLLSMLLIAFLVSTKNKVNSWGRVEDDKKLVEQVEKFNKEYEVYDKDLMYGVDVISCLNKAYSNNLKIDNKYGENLDKEYAISVKFILKTQLQESLIVYHLISSNNEVEYTTGNGYLSEKLDNKFMVLSKPYKDISNFNSNSYLKTYSDSCQITTKEFVLDKDKNDSDDIIKILSIANSISETVKNLDPVTSKDTNGWTKAIFRTVLYDLKTRKFKCTKFEYNEKTGRVSEIVFQEY